MQELAIGIDIGGTNTKYGIVGKTGNVLAKGSMLTVGETPEAFVADLKTNLQPLIEQAGASRIAGVGIGAPTGNYHTGEIVFSPNLPWKGVIPMAALIGEALGMKAALTNDAKAAAIGEMKYGAATLLRDFIMITLGTGLGSGFVANGQLIYGHDGFAGELGHVTAVRNGRKCGCGRNGCLETYASATGIVRTAREWLETKNDDTVLRLDTDNITAHSIQTAALEGDQFALELYEFTGSILGRALADAVAVTSPEAIIFFGGLAKGGGLILGPAQRHMEENLLKLYKGKISFLLSALPDADAALVGASALVWS